MPEILDPINLNRLPQYTVLLMVGIVLSIGFMVWWLRDTYRAGRIVDVCLAGGILGVIVARGFHVALNWAYFSENTAEITRLRAGGLDWHGAVIGALLGVWMMGKLRGVRFGEVLVPLTFILPFMALMSWWGCYEAFCSYGVEVDNLSKYPAWQVWEARDIYNMIEPRYRTQQIGMGLSVALFALLALYVVWRIWKLSSEGDLTGRPYNGRPDEGHPDNGRFDEGRTYEDHPHKVRPDEGHPDGGRLYRAYLQLHPALFWLSLAVFSAGMFIIGEMRGDFAEIVSGLRADQWLDGLFVVVSLLIFIVSMLRREPQTTAISVISTT